jgi:GxxExxY protein
MPTIIHKELSYTIYGLCFKTHNILGRFRNENTYADFLETLFKSSNLHYLREVPLPVTFEGERPGRNRPDFIIEDKIILDLKAKRLISKEDYFQMQRYLHASGKNLGIIVNFRQEYIKPKRIAN